MSVTSLTSGLLVTFSYRRKLRTLYLLTLTWFHSNVHIGDLCYAFPPITTRFSNFKFQFYVTCFSKEVGYLSEGINNILASTKTRQNLARYFCFNLNQT